MAYRAGKRLTSLLSDILDLSRIEVGQMPLVDREFKLAELLSSLAEVFPAQALGDDVAMTFRVEPGTPAILVGDDARVRQVLLNFVGNAVKFTPKGEISIAVAALSPPARGAVRLVFTIRDTGIGMPADKLSRIFEPFIQIDNDFTRTRQGAGLGLSIAKNLVERMGGSLSIESREGKGTAVSCTLPFGLSDSRERTVRTAGKPGVDTDEHRRILLVEDDPINRFGVRRLLEKRGHDVTVATNGREALEIYAERDFDLILMDVQMPVMNGVEATRAIRESSMPGGKAHIPIIAMTAYAMPGDKEKFLAAGMTRHIAKPLEIKTLTALIREIGPGAGRTEEDG